MKLKKIDIIHILTQFNIAEVGYSSKLIRNVSIINPITTNQLIDFIYDNTRYFILIDQDAKDHKSYILNQIADKPEGSKLELIFSNSELGAYGTKFKGKDVYLVKTISPKIRLDIILAQKYPEITRTAWQNYIQKGHVKVNGQTVTISKTKVNQNSDFTISKPPEQTKKTLQIPIIWLSDDYIVINKPAGILTHAKGEFATSETTVADFFRDYTTVNLDSNRPGIVHRLDRATSGIMVGARTNDAYRDLVSQFSGQKIHKQYLAIVDGTPKNPHARLNLPIARNPKKPSTFRVSPEGKNSVTEYKILSTKGTQSLVLLKPSTGRTHQLRVHMAYIGHPIVGDKLYNTSSKASRLFLHAKRLQFIDLNGDTQNLEAQTPQEFIDKFPEAESI